MAYFPHLLAQAVSSVLARFTSVFGMGTGGSTPLGSPDQGSGGGIRTLDLRVMSPTSCHCSTPRRQRKSECEGDFNGRLVHGGPEHGSSPRPLVPLSFTHYCASTRGLSSS